MTNSFQPLTGEYGERPPLGIMPRYVWLEQRAGELTQAIARYSFYNLDESLVLLADWVEELDSLLQEITLEKEKSENGN